MSTVPRPECARLRRSPASRFVLIARVDALARAAPLVHAAKRHAQALVETALVLPLLVTLSLGTLQVVLYAHARDVLISAAQEGARLAAEDGRGLDEGYARATALINAGLGTSVDPVRLDGGVDDELVALHIQASMRPILPLPLVQGLPITAVGRVSRERFRPAGGRP